MRYISTRNKQISFSSCEAIKQGISTDGGLFWPEEFPKVSFEELTQLSAKDYRARAKFVLSKFLTDFSEDEIDHCVESAYTSEKFGSDDIAPLHKLNDNAYVLELWHGPTCAFKDMALQILPHFLTTAMHKTGEDKQAVILVATSGDTGKAALEGFCDVENTNVIVFFPSEGVSEVQRKQMVSQGGKNTFVTAVSGNFDDCQTGVKKIFADQKLQKELMDGGYVFSSANSINWGRLVPQVVYYFSAYCDLLSAGEITVGEPVNFVVPTGNFGDILAGYVAKMMGLPVHQLICASNKNNILTDFINTGVYDVNRTFFTTMSPSMDILVSSNLERLLFALSGNDDKRISSYMKELSEKGVYSIDEALLQLLQSQFAAGYTDESQTLKTIEKYYKEYGYVVDPHTAVALNVYEQNTSEYKTIVLSTASPYKFPASVCKGISPKTDTADEWKLFETVRELSGISAPASLADLKEKAVRFGGVCKVPEMADQIREFLKI